MSIQTKEQLRGYWDYNLNTNGQNSITGALLNGGGNNIVDSMEMRSYAFPLTGNVPANQHFQWDGGVLIWSGTADGTIELPYDAYSASGYRMYIYNQSNDSKLTLTAHGVIYGDAVIGPGSSVLTIAESQNDWKILPFATDSVVWKNKWQSASTQRITWFMMMDGQ
jgi:hypothetical protein